MLRMNLAVAAERVRVTSNEYITGLITCYIVDHALSATPSARMVKIIISW